MLKPASRAGLSRHDAIMNAQLKPYWLKKGELRDNVWELHLQDPGTHTEHTLILNFDQVLTPWPNIRSLVDLEFEDDLISIKLVILHSLAPSTGWNKAPGSVDRTFSSHVAFVRWKIDRGVPSNKALSSPWFNAFDAALKKSHREGLLNLLPKVRKVFDAEASGELTLPRTKTGYIATNQFAQLLGMSNGSQLTVAARAISEEYFAKKGQVFSRAQLRRKISLNVAKKITTETAFRYYKVWLELWELRKFLTHDPIGYRAFKSKRELRKWMKSWVAQPVPTPDIPPYQASVLINQSLKLLLSQLIDDAIDLIEDGVDKKDRIKNVQKLNNVNLALEKLGLPPIGPYYYQDGHLPKAGEPVFLHFFVFVIALVAARVVTAAYSARRDEEIASSRIDCIEQDVSGDTWLRCLIVKTHDRVDKVPVPQSVARAVAVVQRIRALGNKPGNRLYDFACPILKRNVRFELDNRLDQARDYLAIPLLENGEAWHFTPHQFRKFFGVTYFWRWAFPDLTALTLQYRHFNPDVTKGYIELRAAEALRMRDEKLAKAERKSHAVRLEDFDNGRLEFVSWIVKGISSGDGITGPLSKRIRAEIDALKERFLPELQVTESMSESATLTLDAVLEELVKTTKIQTHPEGHSLCGCGVRESDTSLSKCLALKHALTGVSPATASGPDFTFAEDLGCLACPHRGALPSMSLYWENQIMAIKRSMLAVPTEVAADLTKRQALIEQYA